MKVVMGISDRVTRARLRREDRRGAAAGSAARPARDRGLSRHRGGGAVSAPQQEARAGTILELEDVHTFYGSIQALKGISLEVREGEIVTLIGANGAGKSTTLRSINGLNHPREGRIRFQGKDITQRGAARRRQDGDRQSPEGRRLFPRMSVLENLEMGAFQREDRRAIEGGPRPGLHAVPAAGRAEEPEGGDALRRRAADVRDRPRADGASEAADARRAVDGARADLRREDLRDRP